jgi:ATP-dependent helicase/DNAse subunit B
MHQLFYHYGVIAKKKTVSFDIGFNTPQTIQIEKTKPVMEKLDRFTVSGENHSALSASAINSYIDCPLQFYLTRVEKMDTADVVKETIEESMFGTLFHA